jgi:hypothetical protein
VNVPQKILTAKRFRGGQSSWKSVKERNDAFLLPKEPVINAFKNLSLSGLPVTSEKAT